MIDEQRIRSLERRVQELMAIVYAPKPLPKEPQEAEDERISGRDLWECSLCDFTTHHPEILQGHLVRHTDISQKATAFENSINAHKRFNGIPVEPEWEVELLNTTGNTHGWEIKVKLNHYMLDTEAESIKSAVEALMEYVFTPENAREDIIAGAYADMTLATDKARTLIQKGKDREL